MSLSALVVEDLDKVAPELKEVFKRGGIIAYPTETFYGLGADPFNEDALERLFELKGRPRGKPILVVIREVSELTLLAADIPDVATSLIKRYWPGPLTIVFKAKEGLSELLTGGTGKIGVRLSSSPVTQRLVEILRSPLTSTSANPSGMSPARDYKEVLEYFDDAVDVVIKAERLSADQPSTVVDVTAEKPVVIREGVIKIEGF
ncbi:MAG TPA: threonylcarbamoyl-AMP synthase [Deltaproteobacteria bacterium]|nr:threonylcarbamoyl-AMP synthase [Deltaproteobacteria bacterium]